jgi:hypothetical protein
LEAALDLDPPEGPLALVADGEDRPIRRICAHKEALVVAFLGEERLFVSADATEGTAFTISYEGQWALRWVEVERRFQAPMTMTDLELLFRSKAGASGLAGIDWIEFLP